MKNTFLSQADYQRRLDAAIAAFRRKVKTPWQYTPTGELKLLYELIRLQEPEPVTRGERWASFFWVQSMVADAGRRALLHELDRSIATARADLGDAHAAAVSLVGVYHNLVRMWAKV